MILTFKFPLIVFVWVSALFLSLGLRFWGLEHPDPFLIRPFLVLGLLFGPSFLLGLYLAFSFFRQSEL